MSDFLSPRRHRVAASLPLDDALLVVGAGAAGVAATRQGLRVSVVKRYGFCGGGLSLP